MSVDLTEFAIEPNLSENGVVIPLGDGASITIRSADCAHSTKVLERVLKPYRGWKNIPDEVTNRVDARWVAEGLIVTWEGITIDGRKVPYDAEKVTAILQEPKYKALRQKVVQMARNEANFQAEATEELEKN